MDHTSRGLLRSSSSEQLICREIEPCEYLPMGHSLTHILPSVLLSVPSVFYYCSEKADHDITFGIKYIELVLLNLGCEQY